MNKNDIYEQILQESLNREIEDFNIKVTDENSLKSAYNYVVKIIGVMSSLFVELNDIIGYKSLFESRNKSQEEQEFINIIQNIQLCSLKVKRVIGMIYEYVYKETFNYQIVERNFISTNALNAVNNSTHQAQTAVRDYSGQQSIENSCQVYDLTIDAFNSLIHALNKCRDTNVSEAEQSNLVTILWRK